jgi:hypothetical protein
MDRRSSNASLRTALARADAWVLEEPELNRLPGFMQHRGLPGRGGRVDQRRESAAHHYDLSAKRRVRLSSGAVRPGRPGVAAPETGAIPGGDCLPGCAVRRGNSRDEGGVGARGSSRTNLGTEPGAVNSGEARGYFLRGCRAPRRRGLGPSLWRRPSRSCHPAR